MTGARAGDRPKAGRLDLPLDAHLHTDLSPDADVPVNVHAALPARVTAFAAGRPLGEIVRPYFDEVLSAVRSGLFDALGHLDMVKRWLVPHIDPSTFAAAPELYEAVLAALVDPGMAMEVNSSGLRQAAHTSRTRRRGPSGASASSGGVA